MSTARISIEALAWVDSRIACTPSWVPSVIAIGARVQKVR
jgi:hypothetical protein